MQDDRDFTAMPCQRLVDGIIDHLKHHMVQACTVIRITDIHTGAFADCVEALQDLDIG